MSWFKKKETLTFIPLVFFVIFHSILLYKYNSFSQMSMDKINLIPFGGLKDFFEFYSLDLLELKSGIHWIFNLTLGFIYPILCCFSCSWKENTIISYRKFIQKVICISILYNIFRYMIGGFFDINDIILHLVGASISYILLKILYVQKAKHYQSKFQRSTKRA